MKLDSRWAISLSRRHGFWCLRVTNFKNHRCISPFWVHKLTAWNHVSSTSMLTDGFNFPGKFNACHKGSSSQIVIGHDNLFQPPVYLSSATDLYAVNLENSGRRPEYSWHRHCHGVVGCTLVFDCFLLVTIPHYLPLDTALPTLAFWNNMFMCANGFLRK